DLYFGLFFCYGYACHLDLHSFPTRRSSDLEWLDGEASRRRPAAKPKRRVEPTCCQPLLRRDSRTPRRSCRPRRCPSARRPRSSRSEEHTSELQSLAYLVCRLLLEKKNKNIK